MRNSILNARLGGPRQNVNGTTTFEFRFRAGDPVFAGHFPNRPLLPGIFQLELTRLAAESLLNCPLTIREIVKAKFQQPVLPEEILRVDLKLTEKNGTIQARAEFSVGGRMAGETNLLLWRND
jgi:3-hydroxyacyl-[acyl-carrier-protein] dehydratase